MSKNCIYQNENESEDTFYDYIECLHQNFNLNGFHKEDFEILSELWDEVFSHPLTSEQFIEVIINKYPNLQRINYGN